MGSMTTTANAATLAAIVKNRKRSTYDRIMAGDALRYMRVKESTPSDDIAASVIALGVPFMSTDAPVYEKVEVYKALERAYITRAPNNFHDYLIALEWKRPAKSRFYQPRMSVLREAVDALTDMMVNDLYDIIELSMPVRVGKSTLGLLFLSWLTGRNPDAPILATGYAEKITKMFYSGIKEVYEDSDYNYRAIFPLIDLVSISADDLTLDFRDDGKKATRKYKSITCRAIDGSLTGATEARQLLYCDDLVRDIEEALNPARLRILCDKLVTNVYSRKKEGCKELHIGTRWSIHDPMGWVERQNADNPRCKVITLPALDPDTDESNFDYPYGVGFSTEYYRERRRVEDEVTWQCVYQQMPIERAGLLFPSDELKYTYDIPDHDAPDDIFAFCDVAFGGEDYLAMPIAYQWGNDPPVIVDVVFVKGGYKTTEPLVAGKLTERLVRRAVFEANNGGDFYSRDVVDLVAATGHKCHITAIRAASNKSKETRIIQHSPAIKEFTFLHPSSDACTPMYRAFLTGLTTYTLSGKNQNDDAPDSLAGLAAMMRCSLNATVTIYDRQHV
jgi:predicted phage terminase large subunit-like protein